uniref:Putative mercuric reductase n=1 Tax=uncultured bacterium RM57 TaxID=561246 RepID=C8XT96_9BACT|nr:putative mercuric reductase [uncultured bacterium RM57]
MAISKRAGTDAGRLGRALESATTVDRRAHDCVCLGQAGLVAELEFHRLPAFQRIAYKHLRESQTAAGARDEVGEQLWLTLMRELDTRAVRLDEELKGKAKQVLASVQKKRGAAVHTWEEAYQSKAATSLENGQRYSIRREASALSIMPEMLLCSSQKSGGIRTKQELRQFDWLIRARIC